MGLSQDAFAERMYVSRQSVSNWENDKTYPDIHSILLMSEIFGISLDNLVKGDIEEMKEQINKEDIRKFNRKGNVFAALLILMVVSFIPLAKFLGIIGLVIWAAIAIFTLIYALGIEKLKKHHGISTYKEIVAFTEGKRLDQTETKIEKAKKPYQVALLVIISAVITFAVLVVMGKIFNF